MSGKRLNLLIALITLFAAAMLAFAGCKVGGDTAQDILDNNEMTARVVYYANEGKFDNEFRTRNIFFKADTPVINLKQEGHIGQGDPSSVYVKNVGYILDGWYYVERDENDNPVYVDENGEGGILHLHVFSEEELEKTEIPKDKDNNPLTGFDNEAGELVFRSYEQIYAKSSGVKVDFSKRIGGTDSWYFVAGWLEDSRVEYVLASDVSVTIGNKTYHKGDTIHRASFGNASTISLSSVANQPQAATDATYIQAFADENCTELVERVQKPDGREHVKVYAQYVQGLWEIVKTPLDVTAMFANVASTSNYYILNDIDCSANTFAPVSGSFNCTIEGNGHTLRNLNFSTTGISSSANVSMLGRLSSTAKISNITFENVNVNLETASGVIVGGLYLVCGGIDEGAQLSGVKFNNANLTFRDASKQSAVVNLCRYTTEIVGGQQKINVIEYLTDNWMFGGLETDAAFMQKYGVTVNGYSLKVKVNRTDTETLVSVGQ